MPNHNTLSTSVIDKPDKRDPFDFSEAPTYRDPYDVNGGKDVRGAFDFSALGPESAFPTSQEQQSQSPWEATISTPDGYINPMMMSPDRQAELAAMDNLAPLSPGLAEMRDVHAAGMQALARSEQTTVEQFGSEQESLQAMVEQESRERDRSRYIKIGRAVFGPLMRLMARRRDSAYEKAVQTAPDQAVANRYSADKLENPFYIPPQGKVNILEQAATMSLSQRQRFLEENGIIESSQNR